MSQGVNRHAGRNDLPVFQLSGEATPARLSNLTYGKIIGNPMTLFNLEDTPDGIRLTETLKNGGKHRCHFNSVDLAERYMKHRREWIELGGEGAMRKWNREEAKERRKLGLPVKADYSVTHYGDEKQATCGVEKGVEGNIRQRTIDHTWYVKKVTCPECLEKM